MTHAAAPVAVGVDLEGVRAAVARAFPGATVEMRETHISCVFLTAERAFKLKKPVVLDFVDYGTPARRRAMCDEEVRLNRRLAPELYIGVRAVVRRGDRLELGTESDPAAIDYVVEMRRYDEAATLGAAAARGAITPRDIDDTAVRLAAFHAGSSPRLAASCGSLSVRRELRENLDELDAACDGEATARRVRRVGRFLDAFVTAHARLLDRRAQTGLVREVHGDLRAEHVVLRPCLCIVDCVEFDRALRTLDVADDLAFLVMDLCRLGDEAAARRLIAGYRAAGGDCGPAKLVWCYAVHRALIRAKVSLVRAGQVTGGGRPAAELHDFLAIAERCAWRARGTPSLVVCGVPASGKTHLSQALAAVTGATVVGSDRLRKRLAGLAPEGRGAPGLYTPQMSARVYDELGRCAAAAARGPDGVIIDATFRRIADRRAFAAGWAHAGPLTFVQCVAPAAVLRRRALARDRDPARISDATVGVVEREQDRFEPLTDVPAARHLMVRTDRGPEQVVEDLFALLDVRLQTPDQPT